MKKLVSCVIASVIVFSLCLVLSGCATKMSYTYDGFENFLSGNFVLEGTEVHTINLDWVSGDVSIEVVDGIDKISVEETSRYKILENEALRYYLSDDGVLTIKFRASSAKKVNLAKEKTLSIKLPKAKFIKSNLIINAVSADVYVNRIETAKISVTNVSGETTIINSKASIADVISVSGDVKLKNSVLYDLSVNATSGEVEGVELTSDKLKLVNVSGNIVADVMTTPISINAETVSGNINMKFANEKGFTAQFESVSGNFNCDFSTQLKDNKYIYLDGVYEYNFETVSGNVTMNKRQ